MKSAGVAIEERKQISLSSLFAQAEPLARAFYERPTVEVARGLLGKVLVHGRLAGRIVEVEAYLGTEDPAAHAWRGLTERTRVIFGPPGHAYVYFVYGIYECLNLVAEPDGVPGCVLIRALEPMAGLAAMRRRRPKAHRIEELASGPGRLTLAMGISRRHNGADVTRGPLTVRALGPEPLIEIQSTPRIGISRSKEAPLRFLIAGNRFVSRQYKGGHPE